MLEENVFYLEMVSGSKKRTIRYSPLNSELTWQDTGLGVLPESLKSLLPPAASDTIDPKSFDSKNPIGKIPDLRLIKIQVGYGCNFTCTFCSQRSTRTSTSIEKLSSDIDSFLPQLKNLLKNVDDVSQVRVEFWGGETLIYWPTVQKIALELREQWPAIQMLLFTNGSLLNDTVTQEIIDLQIHTVISHEGPMQKQLRHREVSLESKKQIRRLHEALNKRNLFSFNMTLGPANKNIHEIRIFLSRLFEIPINELYLNFDVLMIFDQMSEQFHLRSQEDMQNFSIEIYEQLHALGLQMNWVPFLKEQIIDFLSMLLYPKKNQNFFQKCSMDRPDSIAVDLKGNVLTCQNTTEISGHKIGHLNQFDEISLTTSTHWSRRQSCPRCPVVALCRGSCMYLKQDQFDQTCDNYFSFYLGLLAFILSDVTGMKLSEIRGHNLRGRSVNSTPVLVELH